ncbi:putative acyl-CoA desaturase [Catenaria anguillulae PL171]|uniref:Acyl-CoA desaturase n=1 Tax=Catenaria anguillulae PL171 TaxID=765915 RepID=A0A1Y2HMH5_9FUNG|nr:putative acyl-CoA desaturase [Catenaria anguillulae PL171]
MKPHHASPAPDLEGPQWHRLDRIQWDQLIPLTTEPFLAAYAASKVPLTTPTLVFAIIYYVITATGVTAGYHRLWSHKSFDAAWPLKLWFALAGAGSVQGSIKWWSRRHRAHHRYTDTDADPYSAHRGLLWSHILWLFFKPGPATRRAQAKVDMRDLNADWIVTFQHRFFIPIALTMSFAVPAAVAHFGWNDALGGLVWAGLVRMVLLHHATFCVNSLAHYLGEATYDDRRSPKDHLVTALITMGEGQHSFHHSFPNDYRNAYQWCEWDPTKWLIWACSLVGLTWNLKRFPDNEIRKGKLMMQEKKLQALRHELDWGVATDSLPSWSTARFVEELRLNPSMIVIEGVAHDVSLFIHDHPGGVGIVKPFLGKDATEAFNGRVYDHSTAARNLMAHLRVAKVVGSVETPAKVDELEE